MATDENPRPARLAGLLLVVPALVALVFAYVTPTVWTVTTSFYHVYPFLPDRWAGVDNYRLAFQAGFGHTITFALWISLLPALLAVVVSLPLAVAAHRAGVAWRRVTRAVIAIPLTLVAPAGFAIAWWQLTWKRFAGDNLPEGLWWVVFVTTGGLALGVGVTLYLAALGRREPGRSAWPAVALVGGLAAIAALGLALQLYTHPAVVTGGNRNTATPLLAVSEMHGDAGQGSAIETMLLIVLGVLGVVAAVLIIATKARLEIGPAVAAPVAGRGAVIGTVAGLVVTGLVTGLGLLPGLWRLAGQPRTVPEGVAAGDVFINTWVPPLLSTVVGVGLALVAAIGIGAVRPFGRSSEWLLLPFAPWLLVGSGPLIVYTVFGVGRSGALDSWLGLVPRTWVVIPALFVLTLLLRGQRAWWDRLRASGQPASLVSIFVLPVLPMVALLAGVTWLVQAQDLLRQRIHRLFPTGPVVTHSVRTDVDGAPHVAIDLVLPPVLAIVLVLAAIALQLAYLDRLALRVGSHDTGRRAGLHEGGFPEGERGARSAGQGPLPGTARESLRPARG
jgi:ABC-type sugar transport system permease subunit